MAYKYEYLYKIDQLGVSDYTLKIIDDSNDSKTIFIPVIISKSEDTEENLNNIARNIISTLENEEIQQSELTCQRLAQEELERNEKERIELEQQNIIIDNIEIDWEQFVPEEIVSLNVEQQQETNL